MVCGEATVGREKFSTQDGGGENWIGEAEAEHPTPMFVIVLEIRMIVIRVWKDDTECQAP
jgi:hypothetical protein